MEKFIELIYGVKDVEWVLIAISFISYFYLYKNIKLEKGLGQSITTWILWVTLDVIQFIITLNADGKSAMLLLIFIFGGITTISILLRLKIRSEWNKTDTIITISVPICILLWIFTTDPKWSIVFASIAQFIAGIPLIKKTIEKPKISYIKHNVGFLVLYIVSLMSAKSSQIKDSFFEELMIIYMIITLGILFQEFFRQKKEIKNSMVL